LVLEGLQELVIGLGYGGAFLAGFLGSSSLFIAVFPSFVVVPLLATVLNPVGVGVLAGVGAGVGQFLHYYVGLGGRYLLSEDRRQTLERWRARLDRYGVVLIFLFAATPLTPDDILWIPLGMMRYPRLKALIAAIAGKVVLNLFYAYAGFFGWGVVEEWLRSIGLRF
jgi:membrane protein YqaA with SNARE-associated domain